MMRQSPLPTRAVDVAWTTLLGLLLGVAQVSCQSEERPSNYRVSALAPSAASCAVPSTGCTCDAPGTLVDCGEVRERFDDYVSCTQGVRRCGDDGHWGACEGDLVKVSEAKRGVTSLLAMGLPEACAAANPCDPLCREIVDTGDAYPGLPEGLCSMPEGVALCALCGYAGTISRLSYSAMPLEWRRIPESCTPTEDHCPFDMVCVGKTCQSRVEPCVAPNVACAVDLTLGKPCFDPTNPNATFHVPVCNRGTQALRSGTIRIGVDSRSANVATCLPPTDAAASDGFPNRGYIEYVLGGDRVIEAGTCIDVDAASGVPSPNLDLGGANAIVVNYDGNLAECNRCNNGSVTIATADVSTSSECAACVGDACDARDTTLRGVLYDPAGRNPVPNALVYVPDGNVVPFADGVAVDTCAATVPTNARVWTTTDATGHFSLRAVPSDIAFSIVVQLGRWRRQYPVPAVPVGQTRFVQRFSNWTSQLVLTTDATEPAPYSVLSRRLRLPATERRCDASGCSGEGDIPKIALLLGDADPLECALRRIGIADSEFTASGGNGRVQLFRANGMQANAALPAFGSTGLLSLTNAANAPQLFDYTMLIAPCNGEHRTRGAQDFAATPYASGPSYNSWPDPTADDLERSHVGRFVAAGGRLLTTHWLGLDFVHLNYEAPARANFAATATSVPIVSPFDPAMDSAWASAVAAFSTAVPGFAWQFQPAETFNVMAPVVHAFGNDVSWASNVTDAPSSAAPGSYPALAYAFDTSSQTGQRFSAWAGAAGLSRVMWERWSPMVSDVRAARGGVPLLTSDTTSASLFGTGGSNVTPIPRQACLEGDGSEFDCDRARAWGSPHVGMYHLDTPPGAPDPQSRIGVIAGHASRHDCYAPSNARASKYCGNVGPYTATNPPPDCDCLTFPANAATACGAAAELSEEELSFEYLLFDTLQCLGEVPRQPQAQVLATAGFFRDFAADCASGERPVWRLFSWQAEVPDGTRIDFFAGTADNQDELESTDYLQIGLANASTTTWTAASHTVDELLRMELTPPETSRKWLRVWSILVPNAAASPTLTAWRAVFNCVPNE